MDIVDKAIDQLIKENTGRKQGVATGVEYSTEMERGLDVFCVRVIVTKKHWCEDHKEHAPKKRKEK